MEKILSEIDNCNEDFDVQAFLTGKTVEKKEVQKKKLKLCPTFFKIGKCLNGNDCRFAHKKNELNEAYIPNGR
jgi:hypothetical protein